MKVLSSVTSLKSPALRSDLIWVRTGGLGRTIPADDDGRICSFGAVRSAEGVLSA